MFQFSRHSLGSIVAGISGGVAIFARVRNVGVNGIDPLLTRGDLMRVRVDCGRMPIAGECQLRANANCGQMPIAGKCQLRANANCGQMPIAGKCQLRANANCGRMPIAGECQLRANAIRPYRNRKMGILMDLLGSIPLIWINPILGAYLSWANAIGRMPIGRMPLGEYVYPHRFHFPAMSYNPDKHHRRSIRLKGYDYSSTGVYFITLCTYKRECLFGEILDGRMQLNQFGEIVAEEWLKSAEIRQEIELDNWVVMPNHFHAIVIIDRASHLPESLPKTNKIQMKPRSLCSLVTGFKSSVTRRINQIRNNSDCPVWQRNYYERIVRDPEAWEKIYNYIDANPRNWAIDRLEPDRPHPL